MKTPSSVAWLAMTLFAGACGRGEVPLQTPAAVAEPCAVALATPTHPDPKVTELQERIRRSRDEARALEQLGFHYVTRARRSNDPGDYTLAEQVASCLEARAPGHANALLLRGHVLHQRHRFKEAEAVARQLVARREFVLDYGLLGDALMEQGQVTQAAAAYQRMIDLKPFYQSYIRAAHLRWLTGNREGARELVKEAIAAAGARDAEARAWAYTRLAHYELQAGRLHDAAKAANAALASLADYAAALLARGRVYAAAGQLTDAIADFRRAAVLNPLPEYQWALSDTLRAAGRDDEAVSIEAALVATGEQSDPRTLALFLATRNQDTALALRLAERELEQRADVFTLDAYAWALAAEGRLDEAHAAMGRALVVGTEDARLFLHAASIAAASGRRSDAVRWLSKARLTKFTLLPSELELLRAHTRSTGTVHLSTALEN